MRIKKGKEYLCIKTVVMEPSGRVAYRQGKVYKSECHSCITDETHDIYHRWSNLTAEKLFVEVEERKPHLEDEKPRFECMYNKNDSIELVIEDNGDVIFSSTQRGVSTRVRLGKQSTRNLIETLEVRALKEE